MKTPVSKIKQFYESQKKDDGQETLQIKDDKYTWLKLATAN